MRGKTRIGARRKSDLDPEILRYLNAGVIESATHIEQMCLDMAALFNRSFPEIDIDVAVINGEPFIRRLRVLGGILASSAASELQSLDHEWISDTTRGWLAMAVAEAERLSDDQRIVAMKPYYTDHHFAVREWAWLALRPLVVIRPEEWVARVAPLMLDECHLSRRFAVELLRPRSVWGAHIETFKDNPGSVGDCLADLRCDSSAYVRTAVGNWFNDASKTRPDWVKVQMREWLDKCRCSSTEAIVRRATRSIQGF